MGRRSLPKIDPAIDLEEHLLEEEAVPRIEGAWSLWPRPDSTPDSSAPLPAEPPLEVEVGSGKGLFLERVGRAFPERRFLGIELAHKYARFAAARLAKRDVANAKMVSGDALAVFRERIADGVLAAVHVYFPDPWWKKRHRRRRVMCPEFLVDIQRTLRPGGELHFWTDVQEYFDSTLELLATTGLEGPLDVPESPAEHDLDYRTHFERRMRLHGEPVYRSLFRRPG